MSVAPNLKGTTRTTISTDIADPVSVNFLYGSRRRSRNRIRFVLADHITSVGKAVPIIVGRVSTARYKDRLEIEAVVAP